MKKQAYNPYLPLYEYIPDGEPYVFGDRVYVYGSHDKFNGEAFCMNDYVCWSAPVDDLADWRCEGVIYRRTQDPDCGPNNYMYAPDITPGPDGRYYLYYTLDMQGTMAVAVGDSPVGPFEYYGRVRCADGHILGTQKGDAYQFDPGVLLDDDGRAWMYSGFGVGMPEEIRDKYFGGRTMEGAYCFELEPDMLTVKSGPTVIVPQQQNAEGTPFAAHPFFEASSIRKINGLYYFVYSSTWSHELCYAVSEYPDHGFRPGGAIVSNGDVDLEGWTITAPAAYIGNNHGGLVQLGGQWYIFYHRQSNYHSFSRQGCAEPVTIAADGSIAQVEMTSCGLNGGDLRGIGTYPAAIACQLRSGSGACHMDQAGKDRESHPAFTQTGADREENADQYITNLRSGAVAVYKYFDLSGTQQISLRLRGDAGSVKVYDRAGGELLTEVPFGGATEYTDCSASLVGGKAHSALTLVFETDGAMDFSEITLG